jgi:hypothetical protein
VKTIVRPLLRTTIRVCDAVTTRNGPGTLRGAAATVVSAYGNRRQGNANRTTSRPGEGTATLFAAEKIQYAGDALRCETRLSSAAISTACEHWKLQVRNESLALHAVQRPETTSEL